MTVSAEDHPPIVLPVPMPKKPFFGEENLSAEVKREWLNYYEDVAVLAFPFREQATRIADQEEKALYYRAPYSSGTVRPYLSSPSNAADQKSRPYLGQLLKFF